MQGRKNEDDVRKNFIDTIFECLVKEEELIRKGNGKNNFKRYY